MTKHGPRLALFSQAPPDVPLTSGTLHVRTAGVLAKTKKIHATSKSCFERPFESYAEGTA